MEQITKNRQVATSIGDLVESLYHEVEVLPLSDTAKNALVMVMVGDILKRRGDTIYFNYPPIQQVGEVAA